MNSIVTVTGPIEPNSLGFCHCHEHLAISPGRSSAINPALCIDDPNRTLAELLDYKNVGGCSLVDAQPVGCGRQADTLAALSEQSGVHIIASTGFHKMQFYPDEHWIFQASEDFLSRLFIEELDTGMYLDGDAGLPICKSAHRAGVIKCAFEGAELSGQYEKCFLSAVNAANRTGASIMVHIEKDSSPAILAAFLMKNHIAPARVAFCHMDRTHDDMTLHYELTEQGFLLEYDTIGRERYHSDEKEVEIIEKMITHGFGKNLLLGLDVTRDRLKYYGGNIGLSYIKTVFLPKLHNSGIGDDLIKDLLITGPSRFLPWQISAPIVTGSQ